MEKDSHPIEAGKDTLESSDGFRTLIGPLLLLTVIFFLNFIARVVYAPLLPEIEKDLNITHSEAGSLFFFISIGYFIALLASGWIAARLNHRKTITLSSIVLGLTLIGTAFSQNLWMIRSGLLFLGMAAGLYLPSGIATLTNLFSARHWGKAIAVHELAPNLGFVVAPVLSELIMMWFSWRGVLVLFGVASIFTGVVFSRFGRGGEFTGVAPSVRSIKYFLGKPAFWIMIILFGLGISSTLGIYAMLPLFLVTTHAIDRNFANTLVALSRLSGLFMALAGGWATDRYGPGRTMVVVFLLTGINTIILGAASSAWVIVFVFIQPLLAVCFFPAGCAALSRIGPPDARNIAVSLTVPFAFLIGGGAVPIIIGLMGDAVSFSAGIALVGGFIITGSVLSYFLNFDVE